MHLSTVVAAPFTPVRPEAENVRPDALDAVFRRNIATLIRHLPTWAMTGAETDDGQHCGQELDQLALNVGRPSGTRALNLALMRCIKPTRTVAAVVSATNESGFLLECVAHYRAIGFEHVFLYTNGNSDGSDALLDALDRTGFVTVIRNEVGPAASPQVKAYEHSVHLLTALRDFEWVSYFDVNEFLIPAEHHDYSIMATIAAFKHRYSGGSGSVTDVAASAICFNSYGSQEQIPQAEDLIRERLSRSVAEPTVKSLVRLADIGTMAAIHLPGPDGLGFVNAAFDPITVGPDCMAPPPDLAHGWLSHYGQNSFNVVFECNTAAMPENHHPMPPRLLARLHNEVAALQAVPAIAAATRDAADAQRTLSQQTNGLEVEAKT